MHQNPKIISLNKRIVLLFFSALLLLTLNSCKVTNKLQPNEYLLDKTEILNTRKTKIEKDEFETFIRQKPNRKFFRTFHFFVWWYNKFDNEKIAAKKQKRNEKYDKKNADKSKKYEKKNEERVRKGKKPKTPKLKNKDNPTFLESLRDIGEPPVILDSMLTEQTRQQLSKFLFSKGYFNNKVNDSVSVNTKTKKATVFYKLQPGPAYTVTSISYQIEDEKIANLVLKDTIHSLIKWGMVYDAAKFQEERQRITNFALNNGYYYFENAYIKYDIDTNAAGYNATAKLKLRKFSRPYSSTNDSLVFVNHTRYKIENIYVITELVTGNLREHPFKDTLRSAKSDVIFLLNQPLAYRPAIIYNNIDIRKGAFFKKDTAEITYKALLGLGIFKNVTIQFLKSQNYSNQLDCYIICNPLIKQSATAEMEGINTSGNLGVDGSLVYQNRNFFRGGELVEVKLQGAFIAQQQFNADHEQDLTDLNRTFNTLQFGPEASFSVPRAFFPFSLLPFKKEMSPRTYVRSSVNYQSRPEFSRVITDINYGFSFQTHQNRLRHDFVPFEAYLVRANLINSFRQDLINLSDAFLLNSFQDHITTVSKYGITYTSKENTNTSRRTVNYIRWNIMSSGNILRQYFKSRNAPTDSTGNYLLFGIPFAQFLRTDIDYRIYIPVHKKSRLVYRLAGGIGKPLENLGVLPYEQSFFSGGPNSVRAWRARTLGPGGYDPRTSSAQFDKIGDILLEGNFEYRFHVIKSFNGAFFVDAGNIWRLHGDITKPGAEFILTEFYKQIAIGSGLGVRWDLSFFVLRFDFGVPVRDPKYDRDDRWTYNKKPWRQVVVNFGIGYPF